MFFEALYFGHVLSLYTMQLEPPKKVVLMGHRFPIFGVLLLFHLQHTATAVVAVKKVPTRTGPCCTPSTITRHSQGLAPHQGLHFRTKK